jgi:hypothetical protein
MRELGQLGFLGLTIIAVLVGFAGCTATTLGAAGLYAVAGSPAPLGSIVGTGSFIAGAAVWFVVTIKLYRRFRARVPREWYEDPPAPAHGPRRRTTDEVLADVRLADSRLAGPSATNGSGASKGAPDET